MGFGETLGPVVFKCSAVGMVSLRAVPRSSCRAANQQKTHPTSDLTKSRLEHLGNRRPKKSLTHRRVSFGGDVGRTGRVPFWQEQPGKPSDIKKQLCVTDSSSHPCREERSTQSPGTIPNSAPDRGNYLKIYVVVHTDRKNMTAVMRSRICSFNGMVAVFPELFCDFIHISSFKATEHNE